MKLLELFSGQGSISKSFEEKGGKAFKVDWSEKVEADLHADVSDLTVSDVVSLCGGIPDFIWASPQCTTYSIANHSHRTLKEGLTPKTKLAEQDDIVNYKMWSLIDILISLGTKYYFVENPRGRMRHMRFVKDRPRYTITYCSYGHKGNKKKYSDRFLMKPTDIWTNHSNPNFLPQCKKPYPHIHGSIDDMVKSDYLSRGEMPKLLTDHIAGILIDDSN